MAYSILGIGSATVDDLLFVDRFPVPDSKQEVLRTERHGGGLVATACVAAARLGVPTAFADVLGADDLSQWVIADLQREGVDTAPVRHQPDARPIHAFIIVEQGSGSRTILYSTAGHVRGDAGIPAAELIEAADVLLIDDVRQTEGGLLWAVQTARTAGTAVVADLELRVEPALLAAVDHLIVSAGYAARATGIEDPVAAVRALWHDQRKAVVVTCGAGGCWYFDGEGTPVHQPAFVVPVVDTTGCGDVFHGAYAAALTWGAALAERVRLASACAALKAMQPGGRRGIPTRVQLEHFLSGASGAR